MKQLRDYTVADARRLSSLYTLLVLTPDDKSEPLPFCRPGQFVQVSTDTPGVMLRRPISVNRYFPDSGELHLLVRRAGKGTSYLCDLKPGASVNLLLPLGNGFTIPDKKTVADVRPLLVGGGVGVAPLLQLGVELKDAGWSPEFLIGARSESDLLLVYEFMAIGTVHISTDDGSCGTPGVVTLNPALEAGDFNLIYCCGPAPMMKAVAAVASERGIDCEVSLENMMACGLGACLCCVEKTVKGNVCVCTEGPVFNINQLTWLS